MNERAIDRYLSTLLAYAAPARCGRPVSSDCLGLVHAPAQGPESVRSLVWGADGACAFTLSRFRQTVWEWAARAGDRADAPPPPVDVLRARVEPGHPVFNHLDARLVRACRNRFEGGAGMDYYLLLWRLGGESQAVECYEPHLRQDAPWTTLVNALQTLSSQYEYAAL